MAQPALNTAGQDILQNHERSELMAAKDAIDAALATNDIDALQVTIDALESQFNGDPSILKLAQHAEVGVIRTEVSQILAYTRGPKTVDAMIQQLEGIRGRIDNVLSGTPVQLAAVPTVSPPVTATNAPPTIPVAPAVPPTSTPPTVQNGPTQTAPSQTPAGAPNTAPNVAPRVNSIEGAMRIVLLSGVNYDPTGDPASAAIRDLTRGLSPQDLSRMVNFLGGSHSPEIETEINDVKNGRNLTAQQLIPELQSALEKAKIAASVFDNKRVVKLDEVRAAKEKVRLLEKAVQAEQGKKPYNSTEAVLAMIHWYNESQKTNANYLEALKRADRDMERNSEVNYGTRHRIWNELSGGVFKRTLKGTFQAMVKENIIKNVKEEDLMDLAKRWDDERAVANWVNNPSLPKNVVPELIGYLDTALRSGGMCHLNTLSLNRARVLSRYLKRAMRQRFATETESMSGTDKDKMLAYFQKLNAFGKDQQNINGKKLVSTAQWAMGKNFVKMGALPIALTVTGGAAGLGLAQIMGGTVALAAGGMKLKANKIENKAGQAIAQRALTTTAMAAGGVALGLSALPVAALAATGLAAGPIYRNWEAIKKKGGTVGRAAGTTLKVGLKGVEYSARTALYAAKLGLGITVVPFFFKGYRASLGRF